MAVLLLPDQASAANCIWNGQLVVNGASITAWETSTVPFGQMCHSESRRCNDGVFGGIGFTQPSCSMQLPQNCTFNGSPIAHGSTVRAYAASSPPAGQTCTSIAEDRLCYNGDLSGSYTITACSNTQGTPTPPPAECQFNGTSVPNGGTVTAYGMVPDLVGGGLPTCEAQTRICFNGVLSGTYTLQSCPDVVDNPRPCKAPDGGEIAHGRTFTYYQVAQVQSGQVCAQFAEQRVCNNGVFSGSATHLGCSEAPSSCPFNGMLIPNGAIITAFLATTPSSGVNCNDISFPRTCTNGVLDGDSSYKYLGCTQNPIPCTFNGTQIPHTGSVVAYASPMPDPTTGECLSEVRHCQAGVLDRSYNSPSCSDDPPPTQERPCPFNGAEVLHGNSVPAYRFTSVPDGDSCTGSGRSEARWCWDGRLTGSFTYSQCAVRPPTPGTNCSFAGRIIANGGTVTAYSQYEFSGAGGCPTVAATLTCRNGELQKGNEPQGDYVYPSCITLPPQECNFEGEPFAIGATQQRYWKDKVPYNEECEGITIKCDPDGFMSATDDDTGSVVDPGNRPRSCEVEAPKECTFGWQMVKHGESVIGYLASEAPAGESCASETRTCDDGTLSGSYEYDACTGDALNDCTWAGGTVKHGESVTAYQGDNLPAGETCVSETRLCNNGTLSGTYEHPACVVGFLPGHDL